MNLTQHELRYRFPKPKRRTQSETRYRLWIEYTDYKGNVTRKPSTGTWRYISTRIDGETGNAIMKLAYPYAERETEFVRVRVCTDKDYQDWVAGLNTQAQESKVAA